MEHDYWVVDELRMEPNPGQFVGVRRQLRGQIASKLLSGSYSTVRAEEGHDVIVPVQIVPRPGLPAMEPAAEGDVAVASRHELAEPESGISQVSAELSDASHGREINQAVYERYVDEGGVPGERLQIKPAVRSRVLPDEERQVPQVTGVQTLGYQPEP